MHPLRLGCALLVPPFGVVDAVAAALASLGTRINLTLSPTHIDLDILCIAGSGAPLRFRRPPFKPMRKHCTSASFPFGAMSFFSPCRASSLAGPFARVAAPLPRGECVAAPRSLMDVSEGRIVSDGPHFGRVVVN